MKSYQSHKIVKAVKCDAIIRNDIPASESEDGEKLFTLQANDGTHYEVANNFFARGEPQGAFYIVEYEDGYRSWSPAQAFEGGYIEICDVERDLLLQAPPTVEGHPFDFGVALRCLHDGKKVCRKGWNGKGMFVVLMPSLQLPPYSSQEPGAKVNDRTAKFIGEDTPLDSQPYFAMRTATGQWQPGWTVSTPDALAKDWQIAA